MHKRITCFINSLTSGGAERQILLLAGLLADEGYQVTLATFGDVPDLHVVPDNVNRARIAEGKGKVSKLLGILSYFCRVKTDCVISFGQRENLFCLIPLLFRKRIKVIAGERNFTINRPDRTERYLLDWFYKRADYVVPNSFSQRKHIVDLHPEYDSKVVTITNYTDVEKYRPGERSLNPYRKIAIFCRYDKQKNYERFAHAVALLKQKFDYPFQIHWYGDMKRMNVANQDYLKFKRLIAELDVADKLKLHDHVLNVKDEMIQYDIIALPSLYEGFSNSISEAICCGIPMVVSNVSDNPVMVHDGINGYLCDPYDISSIASALESILRLTDKELTQMGRESRKIAESLFDKNKFRDSYIKLIEG